MCVGQIFVGTDDVCSLLDADWLDQSNGGPTGQTTGCCSAALH